MLFNSLQQSRGHSPAPETKNYVVEKVKNAEVRNSNMGSGEKTATATKQKTADSPTATANIRRYFKTFLENTAKK